jgi:hypothetical protein
MSHKRKLDCLKNNQPVTPFSRKTKKLFDNEVPNLDFSSPGLDALPLQSFSPISGSSFICDSPNDSFETPTDTKDSKSGFFEDSDDEFLHSNDDGLPSTPPKLTQTQSEPNSPKGLYPARLPNSKLHVNAFSPMRTIPKFNLPKESSPFEKPSKRRKSEVPTFTEESLSQEMLSQDSNGKSNF